MAAASIANYDPIFNAIANEGDIIIAGRNFGTGSSREQAATCLKLRGIQCVIAASFSQTYKRNAFNNGFLVMESYELYDALLAQYSFPLPRGEGSKSTIPGSEITIDFTASMITMQNNQYPFSPLSTVAQELIINGGAEAMVKQRL